MIPTKRNIIIYVGGAPRTPMISADPVELYDVSTEQDVDMALMDDLHSPIEHLTFVGGEQAKQYADKHKGTWVQS
jgi:hypothetical protein